MIDLPGENERESMSLCNLARALLLETHPEILRLHLRDEALAEDINIHDIATKTDCYSGSDLKSKSLFINFTF
jgi:hypothetical protein